LFPDFRGERSVMQTSKTNSITVEHEDGTIDVYKGFHKNSIFVKLGQSVYPQTNLGVLEEFNLGVYRADFFCFLLVRQRNQYCIQTIFSKLPF
jgi:hypothetical protein